MKTQLNFLGRYAAFWIIYFFASRLIFLIYHITKTEQVASFGEISRIFLFGLKMDASITGYFLMIPVIFLTVNSFFNSDYLNNFIKPYTGVLLFFSTILVMTDLRIYDHWSYKLDIAPFLYFKNPEEAAGFVTWTELIIGVPAIFIFAWFFWKIFKRHVLSVQMEHKPSFVWKPLSFLVLSVLLIVPIRGGVGISPINESSVYFSENQFSNHAATNVLWNFVHSISEMEDDLTAYQHMNADKAKKMVDNILSEENSVPGLLKITRPNIILVMMESMTRKFVYAKMDEVVVTPHLNRYGLEGIYFSNFFASGERTNKGLAAILSGQPSMPQSSIIGTPKKAAQLPSLIKELKVADYTTSFYHGGDIEFDNMKSYILSSEPDKLIDKKDFDAVNYDAKWGVHDSVLYEKVFEECQNAKNPFFKTILTLSNHEPFDVPQKSKFKIDNPERHFANAANYADRALSVFIEKIRKTPMWDSTLMILVADHSTVMPWYSSNYEIARFKIPMVWMGGALETGHRKIKKYGDQTDIAVTLLNQLKLSREGFKFGKDLFDPATSSFAYYAFNKGFGFVSDSLTLIYDNKRQDYLEASGNGKHFHLDIGKAFQQVVSIDYGEK